MQSITALHGQLYLPAKYVTRNKYMLLTDEVEGETVAAERRTERKQPRRDGIDLSKVSWHSEIISMHNGGELIKGITDQMGKVNDQQVNGNQWRKVITLGPIASHEANKGKKKILRSFVTFCHDVNSFDWS